MGHQQKQLSFIKTDWQTRFNHGGTLRKKRAGRGMRPLSTKDPLHVVFKANKQAFRKMSFRGYRSYYIIQSLVKRYAKMFAVKIEQISIQHDHIHIIIRAPRRSRFHYFFRVLAGQIAQVLEREGLIKVTDTTPQAPSLWKHRPFSRVVRSRRAYNIVRDYIQLNEKEALSKIAYKPQRLRGLSAREWAILWS